MNVVGSYRGFEIQRTSAGHLVVVDPAESPADRARLVELLSDAGSLDALFFPCIESAQETIDEFIALGLVQGM